MSSFERWLSSAAVSREAFEASVRRAHPRGSYSLNGRDTRASACHDHNGDRCVADEADVSITNLNLDPLLATHLLQRVKTNLLDHPAPDAEDWNGCFPWNAWPSERRYTEGRTRVDGLVELIRFEAVQDHHNRMLDTRVRGGFNALGILDQLAALEHEDDVVRQRVCERWLRGVANRGFAWGAPFGELCDHHHVPAPRSIDALLNQVPLKDLLASIGKELLHRPYVAFHVRVRSPSPFVVLRPSWGEAPADPMFSVNIEPADAHGYTLDLRHFGRGVPEYLFWPDEQSSRGRARNVTVHRANGYPNIVVLAFEAGS